MLLEKRSRGVLPAGPQVRSYPAQFEVRGLAGSQVELRGYATVYDQPYEMFDMFGPYTEVARAGMCAKTLAEGCDTAYLSNHEGLTMARTKSSTLALSEDSTGLLSVATVNTTRSDVRDLVIAIEDENVDEMSFAFRMVRQDWSPDWEQRDLIEVNLHKGDVSAVNYGANPWTSVDVQRSYRNRRAADAARVAAAVREGRQLSSSDADLVARILTQAASASDHDESSIPVVAPVDDAGLATTLRWRHEHEADRPRLVVNL